MLEFERWRAMAIAAMVVRKSSGARRKGLGAASDLRTGLNRHGCYLLSTVLDFPKEERMMQQSSVSISLNF